MNKNQEQQKKLINNTLDYYFANSVNKYDTINLIIAILNDKVDTTKTIFENLEQIKNI
jgi:hypothetical protein